MDTKKAMIIRNVIRVLGCICAVGAIITAALFRYNPVESTGACMASRIFAFAMFVIAVVLLVFDFATKTFSPTTSAIGLGIALVGFIGSFVVAPGSSLASLSVYAAEHLNSTRTDVDTTQLELGSYMVLAAGIFALSYNIRCMKTGK